MSLDVTLYEDIKCPDCGCQIKSNNVVFEASITHNLGRMAEAAGIYKELWRPEEIGIEKAGQLVSPLTIGLQRLRADPEHYKTFEPGNKWGTYNVFIPWIERYMRACCEYPDTFVEVSR